MDYVTEKLYDGFEGGCLPIYLGAPNVDDFLPSTDAIVKYENLGSPVALFTELLRINADPHEWTRRVAWRTRPVEEMLPGYRRLVELEKSGHSQCRLCRVLMDVRIGNHSAVRAHRHKWAPALPPLASA